MNKNIFFLCAVILLFSSCKPVGSSSEDSLYSASYSSIEYKNDSVLDISFKNAADEEYTLKKGETRAVDSDKRGRGDIVKIKPAYVTWKQNKDMYHIEFVDREKYEVQIENFTGTDVVLTENNEYLEPVKIKVSLSSSPTIYRYDANTGNFVLFTEPVYVYTKNPLLQVNGSWTVKKSTRSNDKKLVYGIFNGSPPSSWK